MTTKELKLSLYGDAEHDGFPRYVEGGNAVLGYLEIDECAHSIFSSYYLLAAGLGRRS